MERAAVFELGSQSIMSSVTLQLYALRNWLHLEILSHLKEGYHHLSLPQGG